MRIVSLILLPGVLSAAAAVDYSRDIQPLLEKRCGGCHGGEARMGELSISSYELLIRGGNHGPGAVPGKPGDSPIYTFVTGASAPKMPMDGTTLADGEIALLKAWIEAGAKGPAGGASRVPGKATKVESEPSPALKLSPTARPRYLSLALQPGGQLVALGGFQKVTLADARTGKAIATLAGHADTVRNTAFSPDGKWLAAAGGVCAKQGEVKIWDVEKRTELVTIRGHADCIYGLAFSPDGKLLATSSYDKLIKLWDPLTGQEVRTLKDHIDAVFALAFTPDGRRLVSGSADRGVKVWDTASGERLYTFSESTDAVNTLAIDPTGKLVAAAGVDKSIRIWRMDERSGELLQSSMSHEDAILKLAWSPDGKTIASSSADKSIKLLRASDLSELKRLGGQSDWTYGLAFSPDGKQLVAARLDGSYDVLDSSIVARQ